MHIRHAHHDYWMADLYACQPSAFGRDTPQAAKAAFLKEAFGLSLALTASSGVQVGHPVAVVRGWTTSHRKELL